MVRYLAEDDITDTAGTLGYEPRTSDRPRWRRLLKPCAVALSAVACIAPAALAIYAWVTHFAWLRSGAYARNSFPMGAFALEMTWLSAGCVLLVAVAWCIAVLWRRRRPAAR
jgi:hypothetical protein